MWNVSSNWLVYFVVALFIRTAFLWHSETSAAVTLLLDADWMMLTISSNQGEAKKKKKKKYRYLYSALSSDAQSALQHFVGDFARLLI